MNRNRKTKGKKNMGKEKNQKNGATMRNYIKTKALGQRKNHITDQHTQKKKQLGSPFVSPTQLGWPVPQQF